MKDFEFTEEERDEIETHVFEFAENRSINCVELIDRIESLINERGDADGWVKAEDVTEEGYYYCVFGTITGEEMQCVVTLQYVPRHCFEKPPMDKRLFVYPSGGHEIKTARYLRPLIPQPPKQ